MNYLNSGSSIDMFYRHGRTYAIASAAFFASDHCDIFHLFFINLFFK